MRRTSLLAPEREGRRFDFCRAYLRKPLVPRSRRPVCAGRGRAAERRLVGPAADAASGPMRPGVGDAGAGGVAGAVGRAVAAL
jgi:hypothetical protein